LFKSFVLGFYNLAKYGYHFWNFYKRERLTPKKRKFEKSLNFFRASTIKGNENGILLVQMAKDFEYTIKMAAASKALADKCNLIVKLHDPLVYWKRKEKFFNSVFNFFCINSYEKIHLSFADSIDFKNSSKYRDKRLIANELDKIIIYLNSPSDILSLKFDEILVGDLIYDTYLRFYHKPTINEINQELIYTIETALNIYHNFKYYLSTNNVKKIVNIYTTYIQHGITARLCLHHNIEVYSVAYVIQKITTDFPYHQINHTLFSAEKKLSKEEFSLAKSRLESRFAGTIDAATSYMRISAYSAIPLGTELKQMFMLRPRNIVIYIHEFYDSPHINRVLQFPDLYQYLKQTLEKLTDLSNTSVFVKLHPNAVIGCREEAITLVDSFKVEHFHILDESISNLNIIELRPNLVCTARGTVGIEMAYFGIPTVALFDNLYANFNFVHTCYSIQSYFSILRGEMMPEINFEKEKIISFYYQAYIEKMPIGENNIFNILASYTFKYDTYRDDYLDKIFELEKIIFSKSFIDYHEYTGA
jgi:hypothetical protein